jgi:ABC-type polysaccharide/polyol phosphate transport system ATPase subunit
MQPDSIAITVENVTQRFRVIRERPDTVRELFAKFLHHKSNFHDFDAVKNASFAIKKGEMVGLIGRNGSGKSTLLKIIAGVYKPTEGCVEVSGSIAPLLELGSGFHSELTGRENILLNGLLLGFSKREMQEREQSIIDFAEIGDFIDAPVKQYSSGMYIRLAFAVASSVDPDILILDEILAVGDIGFQQKCLARLQQFRQAGKTIVLVTHGMQQVLEYCHRAILLSKGRVMADGHPEEVTELYRASVGLQVPELVDATRRR